MRFALQRLPSSVWWLARLLAVSLATFGVLVALFGSQPGQAASAFEFGVWMRDIDQRSVSVQRHLSRGDALAAELDAQALALLYGRMAEYFAVLGEAEDAVQMSREGQQWMAEIPQQLARQDLAAASRAALRLARACNDCHDAYKPLR